MEFNPAHVAEQRKVNGKRGVKTDVVDASAMFDLLVAGRGSPVGGAATGITELGAGRGIGLGEWCCGRLSNTTW